MNKRQERPFELTFEKRKGYLYARISASSISRQTALDYLSEVADECANIRCKRLLLERDIPEIMSEDDAMATMGDFVRLSSGLKIAFVNRHPALGDELQRIVEYAAGRGANFRFFRKSSEAEVWLLSNGE